MMRRRGIGTLRFDDDIVKKKIMELINVLRGIRWFGLLAMECQLEGITLCFKVKKCV